MNKFDTFFRVLAEKTDGKSHVASIMSDGSIHMIHANPFDPAYVAAVSHAALYVGADGITEVCMRELIPYNEKEVPCIYHGMPLRPEFRVFYDFDRHQPLYVVNYWDWDYCHDAICRDHTDKIVYETYYPTLIAQYEQLKDSVVEMVVDDMKDITGFPGIWSVDVLYCEPQEYEFNKKYEGFWLIDMALGHRSAYWDPNLAKI